jgi:integrase
MGVLVRPDKDKPGRVWWVRVNYKRRRVSRSFNSKRAAQLAADKIDAGLKLGNVGVLDDTTPVSSVPTFKDYAEHWLETVGRLQLRESTREAYRSYLHSRLYPAIGHLPLTAISRETVRGLIGVWAREGHLTRKGTPLSRATIRQILTPLGSILSTAEDDGLIPANPVRRLGRYLRASGTTPAEAEVFNRDELRTILTVTGRDFPEWHDFILCLARAGLRGGEASALEWPDVDLASRVLIVRRSVRQGRVTAPKNGKPRRVDMSPQLAACLAGRQSLQAAEAALKGQEAPLRVFLTPDGRPVDFDDFRRSVWAPILRRAGLRYRKPHCLRHTFASLLIEAGEPLPYIQQQLGHHTPAFTLRVYGHLMPRGDRRAVDGLDDVPGRNPGASEQVQEPVTAEGH